MVERHVRDVEVAGSNPVFPITLKADVFDACLFCGLIFENSEQGSYFVRFSCNFLNYGHNRASDQCFIVNDLQLRHVMDSCKGLKHQNVR